MLQDLLRDYPTDTLLSDLDITDVSFDDIKAVSKDATYMIDTCKKYRAILSACDKLAIDTTINAMINRSAALNYRTIILTTHNVSIINHSLSDNELIELYASVRDVYNPLYGYACYHTTCNNRADTTRMFCRTLPDATRNGLRINDIQINNDSVTDRLIDCYTSLTKLKVNHDTRITTCGPFAKSLKILTISRDGIFSDRGYLKDAGLSQCDAIEKLYVPYIWEITT